MIHKIIFHDDYPTVHPKKLMLVHDTLNIEAKSGLLNQIRGKVKNAFAFLYM